ncbi:3-keto-5-aminohexanoate cleavage protein [Paraburkholderia sp. EG287A]|uniref:3-keto-5-aminohexanoate cleavage protein n=1 Tax=Paraburkholderia sp. EG287A TaxID=3237012 RepID=UPI0034D26B66
MLLGHLLETAIRRASTPLEQIANEAIAACEAGASIAHTHVRHPATGAPSTDLSPYREVVSRIRGSGCPISINLTTGPGGGFYPSDEDPNRGSPESTMMTPEARVQHVLELCPEICSLDVATMNFGKRAFVNMPDHLVKMSFPCRRCRRKAGDRSLFLGTCASRVV